MAVVATIHVFAKPPALAWKETPVLNGRLLVQAPSTAQLVGMDHSLMAQEPSQDAVQRVMMDIGASRLVVLAAELYARADGPLCAVATGYIAPDERFPKLRCELTPADKSPLSVAVLSPAKPSPFGNIVFLDTAMVRQADGTLQQLTFFVDAVRPADTRAIQGIVNKIIASIKPGGRILKTGSGVTALEGRFVFDLPSDFTIKEEAGHDFDVITIMRLGVPDAPGAPGSRMVVYLGHHPQGKSAPESAQVSTLKVFGREATWSQWDNGPFTLGETYLTGFGPERSDVVHVFLGADRRESAAMLLDILTGARYIDENKNAAGPRPDGVHKD